VLKNCKAKRTGSFVKQNNESVALRPGLLLLLPPEGVETHVRDLDHLETHAGNITLGVTLTTETGNENLVLSMMTKGGM
jgi:hypothetical protein